MKPMRRAQRQAFFVHSGVTLFAVGAGIRAIPLACCNVGG